MDAIDRGEFDTLREWLDRFYASEAYLRPHFKRGEENYNLYRSFKAKSEKVYKHDIFVPYSYAYLEDMTSYLMLSVLASPVIHSLRPRHTAISVELCLELEELLHWALTEESAEFVLELEELVKNIGIYNMSYLVNYPIVKEKRVFTTGQELLYPGLRESHIETVFDRLHLDAPCPLDMFPEPKIKRLSRMTYVIKRSWEDFEVLKKLEKDGNAGYRNVDDAKHTGTMEQDPVQKRLSEIGLGASAPYYNAKTNRIEVLDCMEDADIVTIAGRRAIIRDTTKDDIKPFMYKFPVLDCRLSGAPGEFFGLATIESIKPTQKEMNLLRSQRRDNIALILNKVFTLDTLAGEVDLSTLYSAPGNVIMGINIKEALDELQVSDVTASSFKESQDLQQDMQNITALTDYARGQTPKRRETATGIIRLQQAAQSRNEWQLRKLDWYVLQPLAKRIIVYLREYLDRADYAAIIGKENHADEFFGLDPDQIKRMLQVQPLTESIVSIKEVDMNRFLQAYDRIINMPGVNIMALGKQLLQKLGSKNIKEILPQLSSPAQDATMQAVGQMGTGPQMAPETQAQVSE